MTNTGFIAAINGVYIVNDGTEAVKQHSGFEALEDTVVSRIEINGDGATDVKADYISSPGTAIKVGALVTAKGDDYFSAITLTSGSVALILGQ